MMLKQAAPGWTNRNLTFRSSIAAVLTAIAELISGALANAIKLPKQVWVLVLLAIVAVAIKMIARQVDDTASDRGKDGSSRTPWPAAAGKAARLFGRRISIRISPIAIPGWLCLFFAFFFYIFSFELLFASSDNQSFGQAPAATVPLASSILAAIAVALTVLGLYMTVGVRMRLTFSADGIFIRDNNGKLPIRWNDVTDMYTTLIWGMPWLVAQVPPNSQLLFLRNWILERGPENTIKICNLAGSGVNRRSVDYALKCWSPFKGPRYSK